MARPWQYLVVGVALLLMCGMALVSVYFHGLSAGSISTNVPVELLHVGPLTAMMEDRAILKYADIGDIPSPSFLDDSRRPVRKPNPSINYQSPVETRPRSNLPHRTTHLLSNKRDQVKYLQEFSAANKKVKTLASRDAEKERAANIGAGKALKSYSSILDSALSAYEGMSQKIEKNIHETMKEKQAASLAAARTRSTKKQKARQVLPDFVRKARSELMGASYVRQRLPPGRGQRKSTRFEVLARGLQHAGHESTERFEATARRRSHSPRRHTRDQAARSVWQSIPPGANTQSLIQTAVSNALAAAFRTGDQPPPAPAVAVAAPMPVSSAGHMQDGAQWTGYLAQARNYRLQESSPQIDSNFPSAGLTAKAAPMPDTAYTVTFSNGLPESSTLASKESESAASRSGGIGAQAILAGDEAGGQPAARLESLTSSVGAARRPRPRFSSEMEAMEQHLKQQVDTIFGPDPSEPSPAKARPGRAAAPGPATAQAESEDPGESASRAAKTRSEAAESKKKEAEKAEERKLQAVVKRLKETERLQKLQQQVAFLRQQRQKIASLEDSVGSLRMQLVRKEAQEAEEQRMARMVLAARARRLQALGQTNSTPPKVAEPSASEKANVTARKGVRVCDGFGCFFETLPSPPPPPPSLSPADEVKQALNGDANLWSMIIPWDGAWQSEVQLDDNGTITASHDDPQGRLLPHNPYQDEARYPDGYHRSKPRAGISNFVAPHLFDDAIVTAQAGFNAGLGRHVRVQQASDWERNWCGELGCVDGTPGPPPPQAEAGNSSEPVSSDASEE